MQETGEERVKGLDYFSLILPTEIRREQHRIKVRITPGKGRRGEQNLTPPNQTEESLIRSMFL